MTMYKCPGMFARDLDSVIVTCPSCGREVEIFTDEPKYRCRCGRLLLREALPRCADWCAAAADCLGEAIDAEELARRVAEVKNDPRARKHLEEIRRKLQARQGAPDDPDG